MTVKFWAKCTFPKMRPMTKDSGTGKKNHRPALPRSSVLLGQKPDFCIKPC